MEILNDDCLIEVFRNLSAVDSYSVSKVSKRLKQIIAAHVINRCAVNLRQIRKKYSVRKFLKRFGRNITHLTASENDFLDESPGPAWLEAQFLMLTKHCHSLRHLTIMYSVNAVENDTIENFAAKLTQVEQLSIYDTGFPRSDMFQQLFQHATRLRTLELVRPDVNRLDLERFENLQTLKLKFCNVDLDKFADSMIPMGARLTHFDWEHSFGHFYFDSCVMLLKILDDRCPNLVSLRFHSTYLCQQ